MSKRQKSTRKLFRSWKYGNKECLMVQNGTKKNKRQNKKQNKKKTANMQILWFRWSWSWDSLPSSVPKS